jgi:hypothetical protein
MDINSVPKLRPSIRELIEFNQLRDFERLPVYIDFEKYLPLLKHRISILIVTDSITFDNQDFGLSMMIAALEENFSSSVYFNVKKATRAGSFSFTPNPSAGNPHYTGFRFNSTQNGDLVINRFDQIWCFGLKPGNPLNGPFTDAAVTSDPLYVQDAELAELSRWMNERQGGIFATGDHAHLGASMCHRIPRVRTMRKWLMKDNPPTLDGYERFDTNRPRNPGDTNIPNDNQEDATPQPIEWIPEYSKRVGVFTIKEEPHPILCAGRLGAIDILPDHQHEGEVIKDHEVDVSRTFSFTAANGTVYSGQEYPRTGAEQTKPKIIARAHTLSQPPYSFGKGATPAREFGLVGVYDGLKEGVGRVVVDSTWHHELNINLRAIAADTDSNNYAKIKTYYRNIGLWLANRETRYYNFRNAAWNSLYTYQASQELAITGTVFEVGKTFKDILKYLISPCLVTSFIIDFLPPELIEPLPLPIDPNPCLTCPPFELFEDAILGEIVIAMQPAFAEAEQRRLKEYRSQFEPNVQAIDQAIVVGVQKGLAAVTRFYASELAKGQELLAILEKAQPPCGLEEGLAMPKDKLQTA